MAKRRSSSSSSSSEQTYGCARCRYPITGLHQGLRGPICPECGADLKRMGLRPLRGVPVIVAVVVRCGIFLAASFAVLYPLATLIPLPSLYTHTIERTFSMDPLMEGFVAMRAHGEQWNAPASITEVTLLASPSGNGKSFSDVSGFESIAPSYPHRLEIRPDDGTYTIVGPAVAPRTVVGSVDRAVVLQWLSAASIPHLNDAALKEALASYVTDFVKTRGFDINTGTRYWISSWGTGKMDFRWLHDWWHAPVPAVVALIAWLLLCWKFARRSAFVVPFDAAMIEAPSDDASA